MQEPATQPAHAIAATCTDCGDPAAFACDACGRALCEHHAPLDENRERICFECALPPRCAEPGCPRRSEKYSGRCRTHHPLWAAAFDRVAA